MTSKAKEQRTTQPVVFLSLLCCCCCCAFCGFQSYEATVEIQQPLFAQTGRSDQAENAPVLCAAINPRAAAAHLEPGWFCTERQKQDGAAERRPREEETDP